MTWFNAWFRYSAVVTLALLLLILPVSAVTQYNLTVNGDNIVIFNGTVGAATWTAPANITSVRYLVIGGGGGGGGIATTDAAGGGGAGGFLTGYLAVTPGTTYNVAIGAGGAGGTSAGTNGLNGYNSSFANTSVGNGLQAMGGGGGGTRSQQGNQGASAGGCGYNNGLPQTAYSLTPMQGTNGGPGGTFGTAYNPGGGGGGAAFQGEGALTVRSGGSYGGFPLSSDISGTPAWYSGGGGGGALSGVVGLGGQGLMGVDPANGAGAVGSAATAGFANTGFGGGGASTSVKTGGNGGSGIVILRYTTPPDQPAWSLASGCYTATIGNYKMFKWNTTGTTTWTIPDGITNVAYLVVAGGGSGGADQGSGYGGGGGGAGGILNGSALAVTPGAIVTVKVGAGGAAVTGGDSAGNKGDNSSFDTIEAMGGGGGATTTKAATNGGSGAGGATAAKGPTAGVSGQGKSGGTANTTDATIPNEGGGGGYGAAGGNGGIITGGSGGLGGIFTFPGVNTSALWLGGGGGGGAYKTYQGISSGKYGGGWGNGVLNVPGDGVNETGGGGGGANTVWNVATTTSGRGGSGVVYVSFFSPPVVASFTSNVSSGYVSLPVQFNDTSVLNPTAWVWNFTPSIGTGMGNTSTMQNPNFTFRNPGTYGVTLYATNATGSGSVSNNIVVSVPPTPTASFTKNATLVYLPDGAFQFTDTSTGGTMTAWQWNYTKSGGASTQFSTSQNPVWSPTTPGTYSIVLNATNYAGSSFSSAQTVIVNGFDAPRASYTINPTTGTPGALILFNDTSTVPSVAGLVYNWSFGTGSVELNPYSDFQGSVGHVYNYGGVYNINLTVSNYNGTSFNYTQAGVTISTEQRMTNWYSPHQVRFRVLDANDNPIKAAYINATAYESSLPGGFAGAQQVLIEMYGINSISASQMVSSAVQMQGYTGDDGSASFTMHGNLKYLVYVTDLSGNSYTKTFYPQMDQYLIRVTSGGYTKPEDVSNILGTQGNATLTFSEPNTTWCTMGLDYLDITGRTTNIAFTAYLLNNQTVMNYTSMAVTGTEHILLNYTVPNVRGQQWKWYYNATVV